MTLLAPFHFLNFTSYDAITSGKIREMSEKKGTVIGPYDTLIAGQALSRGLILVTHVIFGGKRPQPLKLTQNLEKCYVKLSIKLTKHQIIGF